MDEAELVDLMVAFLPETVEGWLASAVLCCLVLSLVLPCPRENSHPAYKIAHRLIGIVGLGAGRLRAAGKIGKITGIFGRKK